MPYSPISRISAYPYHPNYDAVRESDQTGAYNRRPMIQWFRRAMNPTLNAGWSGTSDKFSATRNGVPNFQQGQYMTSYKGISPAYNGVRVNNPMTPSQASKVKVKHIANNPAQSMAARLQAMQKSQGW